SRGRQRLRRSLHRFEPHARTWAVWKMQGLDARTALADLHAAGVIRETPEELWARMGKHQEEPLDPTQPHLLRWALGYANLTTAFDTETGFLPCNHHHLVAQFARGSGGRFAPECRVQVWHQSNKDDFAAPYTVHFLYRDWV